MDHGPAPGSIYACLPDITIILAEKLTGAATRAIVV